MRESIGGMRAVQYAEYGPPSVLREVTVAEPEPGPGRIRIRVQAAAVNRFDVKARAGEFSGGTALTAPVIPGSEAAGIVDRLGDGVHGVQVGQAVFGRGPSTYAEHAVLKEWAATPPGVAPEVAASLGSTAQTAVRALRGVGLAAGETVVVHGAAGGVGQATVQFARRLGAATVIGTASARNHHLLRALGAIPVEYGERLVTDVRAVTDQVDRAVDTAGRQIDELIELTGDAQRVLSLVDFSGRTGIRTSSGGSEPEGVLELVADLVRRGDYTVRVAAMFELGEAAAAHDLSLAGHANGKIVLLVS